MSVALAAVLLTGCGRSAQSVGTAPAPDVTSVYRSEASPTGYYASFCFPDNGYKEVKSRANGSFQTWETPR